MISDEPDEDADSLDDESLIENFLVPGAAERDAPNRQPTIAAAADFEDWPPSGAWNNAPDLDPETVAWFKAHHQDWRRGMAQTLRAWVHTRTQARSVPDGTATTGDETTAT
jgi:hypothetical protein